MLSSFAILNQVILWIKIKVGVGGLMPECYVTKIVISSSVTSNYTGVIGSNGNFPFCTFRMIPWRKYERHVNLFEISTLCSKLMKFRLVILYPFDSVCSVLSANGFLKYVFEFFNSKCHCFHSFFDWSLIGKVLL